MIEREASLDFRNERDVGIVVMQFTQAKRAANPLMGTGRADIIVAGAAILFTALEFFDKEDIEGNKKYLMTIEDRKRIIASGSGIRS